MAGDNSLEILVKLKDEASKVAKSVASSIGGSFKTLNEDFKKIATDFSAGSLSISSTIGATVNSITAMIKNVHPLIWALTAVLFIFKAVIPFIKNSIAAIQTYGQAMGKLESVSTRFGQNADQAKEAAVSLARDGLMNVATAAEGLSRLMAGGLNIEQAVRLMNSYKDLAALGRSSSIDMNQAVMNLTQSFVTERSQLADNSGQWENYDMILKIGAATLGKEVDELTNAERTLAKYNGTLIISQRAQGDAQKVASSYTGQVARMKEAVFNLQVVFGALVIQVAKLVIPVITKLAEVLKGFIEWMIPGAVEAGKRFAMGMKQAVGSAEGLKSALGALGGKASETFNKISKEVKDFSRDMAKMASDFKRRLADLVFSHKDKVETLKKQIDEERRNLDERLKKMAEPYEELKKAAVQAGEDRITDLKVQLDKELAKGASANQEKIEMLRDFISEEEFAIQESIKAYTEKKDAEIELEREKGMGRIDELSKELAEEEEILRNHAGIVSTIKDMQREDDITALIRQFNEEKALREQQHQERLADIREQGIASGVAFGEGFGTTLAGEVGAAIEAALAGEEPLDWKPYLWAGFIDTLTEIGDWIINKPGVWMLEALGKLGELLVVGIPSAVFDFLKGQFAETIWADLLKVDPTTLASNLKNSIWGAVTSTFGWLVAVGGEIGSKLGAGLSNIANNWWPNLRNVLWGGIYGTWNWLYSVGSEIGNRILGGLSSAWANVSAFVKSFVNVIIDLLNDALSRSFWPLKTIRLPRFAKGVENFQGGPAIVGERGPEIVNLPRGSDVIPNNKIGESARAVNQTFILNQVSTAFDVELAMERAAMKARAFI